MRTRMHTHTCTHMHACAHTCTHLHARARARTHTHTHTHRGDEAIIQLPMPGTNNEVRRGGIKKGTLTNLKAMLRKIDGMIAQEKKKGKK